MPVVPPPRGPGRVRSVNVVHEVRDDPGGTPGRTAIDKRPVDGPVAVAQLGLAGDRQMATRHHGGPDKAVYAYAAADLARWADELGRELPDGCFGENLTLTGVDASGAVVGERWQVGSAGSGPLLEVTMPRTPCATFGRWLGEAHWVRRFTEAGAPGSYLRVLRPGSVRAGDPVVLLSRPEHGVTVRDVLRVRAVPADALGRLLELPDLAPVVDAVVRRDLAARARPGPGARVAP